MSLAIAALALSVASGCGGSQTFNATPSAPSSATGTGASHPSVPQVFAANSFCGPGGPCTGGSLTGYAASANGNVLPNVDIGTLDRPFAVAFHAGEVYVASFNGNDGTASIKVYTPSNSSLVADIEGPKTDLIGGPLGIAVDNAGFIYVTLNNLPNSRVDVFAPNANGNVAPDHQISGPHTQLANMDPWGIALDPSGNVYVDVQQDAIFIYPAGASGDVAPMNVIGTVECPAPLNDPIGVAVDADSKVYVTNNGPTHAVTVFGPSLHGKPQLLATIAGSNTGFADILGIAVDSASIYVSNATTNSIEVFPKTANGNVVPASVIHGSSTGLNGPIGLALSQ